MKKTILYILCSFLFFGCNQKKKETTIQSTIVIDTLLAKANNSHFDAQTRIGYADKVYTIIKNRANDSLTRYYYFKLAGKYFNAGENRKFIKISRTLHSMAQESKDSLSIAKSLSYIGNYYYSNFANDSAYYYYSKAEKIYLKLKKKEDAVNIEYNKANILYYEKDYAGCEVAIINVLKSAKQKKDIRAVYDCYMVLGNALTGMNNNENALDYYNKALETTENLKDDPQYILIKAQTYNFIAKAHQKKKEYSTAIRYVQKALQFGVSQRSYPEMYGYLLNNMGYSRFKLGDKAALGLFSKSLTIADSLHNVPAQIASKINMSEYYLAQKDTITSYNYIKDAQKTAHDNKIFEDELRTYELLTKISPEHNAYYNDKYIRLSDSLQDVERATRDKFARIEFETNEVLDKNTEIEAENEKISLQRWLFGGSSLFLLVFIGLLYNNTKQRAKNRELRFIQEQQLANEEIYKLMLEQQKNIETGKHIEKHRISQELHDGVMGRLSSIRLNLFVLNKKTDPETITKCLVHINDIHNVEKEIRGISHDLQNNLFSDNTNFAALIKNLFASIEHHSETVFTLFFDEKIDWEMMGSSIKMHIYRILQESLQNIDKYANAKNVVLNIEKKENAITIEIADDGIGFDPNTVKKGIGIKNMKSRIEEIKGNIDFESKVGNGTKISLYIPI